MEASVTPLQQELLKKDSCAVQHPAPVLQVVLVPVVLQAVHAKIPVLIQRLPESQQSLWFPSSKVQDSPSARQEVADAAWAAVGAIKVVITGKAIMVDNPTFLITSRRLMAAKGVL